MTWYMQDRGLKSQQSVIVSLYSPEDSYGCNRVSETRGFPTVQSYEGFARVLYGSLKGGCPNARDAFL